MAAARRRWPREPDQLRPEKSDPLVAAPFPRNGPGETGRGGSGLESGKTALEKRGGRAAGFFELRIRDFARCQIGPRIEQEQIVAGAACFLEKRQRIFRRGWKRRARGGPAGERMMAGVVHCDGGLNCPLRCCTGRGNKKPLRWAPEGQSDQRLTPLAVGG